MRSMYLIHKILILLFGVAISLHAVPPVLNYAGQVAVNGEAFDGNGLFKFALTNADGTTTYWSNDGTSVDGSEPQASVTVAVNGGLYAVLLGNTAQQGMGAIDPAVFAQHTDAKLRVWFSDGVNGFQQLSPDRPFASVPYAFSAGTAQSTTIADGSINKAMLGNDVIADLNKTVTITRDMLPQDVRDDLNRSITRSMLPIDVLSDINATIGISRLSSEVIAKLDQNTSGGSGVVAGSLISIPDGQPPPAGYSLLQLGELNELVWEEKASTGIARHAFDGVEVMNGKIYFAGGKDGSGPKSIAERYNPTNNTWETLNEMSINRRGIASSVLNDKLYVIGGVGLSSVEIFDPSNDNWVSGVSLPGEVQYGTSITIDGKIYLVGGRNAAEQNINQVLCFDPATNQWSAKANMPTARQGMKLVWFENRIWAIGGYTSTYSNKVESYDPTNNSWQTEASLTTVRHWPVAWIANGRIYVGGGRNSSHLNSIEYYDPRTNSWKNAGNFPENKYLADAVVLNNKVYVIGGETVSNAFSNKVFAADLNASVAGVYDLYRKDGNASAGTPLVQAEVADGSVTGSKMADGAITTDKLSEQILKYLKPDITSQPQAQTVYEDTNVSFSVTAEGKYLTYQWKKNGVDLTGETNATLNITDANATLHDGNYSVVVSNDFGSELTDSVSLAITPHPTKLWIAFSENGNTSGKYSPFWELNVTEKKPLLVDNLSFSIWNDYAVPNNNDLESITTNTTFDKDKHVLDTGGEVYFPFSTSEFGVPSTFTEYFGTDVQKMIDELHGASITQYEAPAPGGNTVTRWKVETELDLNYTKFTFADPDHETAIASWMASASVANLVEIVITESVDRPDIDNLTDEQIANTFNSPKLSLKCGDIWTGDLDIPVEQWTKMVIVRNNNGYPELFNYAPSWYGAPLINEGKWNGMGLFFANNNALGQVKSPEIIEFYFEKAGSGRKVKFSEGNPPGSHCGIE